MIENSETIYPAIAETNKDKPKAGDRHYHRLDRLDHLRAIAALLVLFWHAASVRTGPYWSPLAILREGYTGVSLFCVISGFIFSYTYLSKKVRYFAFLKKRAFRIGPLFLFYLVISFYTSNLSPADLLIIVTTTIKFGQTLPSWMAPDWSLLVEIQFYLVFPFLISFVRKMGVRYLFAAAFFMVLLRFIIFMSQGAVQAIAYWTILGRMDQFVLGMLGGTLLGTGCFASVTRKSLASLIGLIATVSIISFFHWFHQSEGGFLGEVGAPWSMRAALWIFIPMIEGICYTAMVVGYVVAPIKISIFPLNKIGTALSFLGMISYSFYMNQFMTLSWVWILLKYFTIPVTWYQSAILVIFPIFPALLLVSIGTYYFIERPFLNIKEN